MTHFCQERINCGDVVWCVLSQLNIIPISVISITIINTNINISVTFRLHTPTTQPSIQIVVFLG